MRRSAAERWPWAKESELILITVISSSCPTLAGDIGREGYDP